MKANRLKKWMYLSSLAAFVLLGIVACETNKASNGADSSYVLVKELEFINQSIESKEPGVYIYKSQVKNNSEHTIRGLSIEIQLDGQSYTTLTTQDTLLPGEVSGYVECFGPASGSIEDMKATRIILNMYDDEFRQTRIQYDVNQDQYTYTEEEATTGEPTVLAKDLELVNPTLSEANNQGFVTYQAAIENHSNQTVTGVVYTFETPDGQTINLVALDSIGAQETSPVASVEVSNIVDVKDLTLKQIKYVVVNEKGQSQQVTYDVRLDYYFMK